MSLGTNRITSFGHQAVYTVPAGKRATVNTTVHANSAAPLVGIAANALGSYPSSTAVTDPAALFYSDTGTSSLGGRVAIDGNYAVAGGSGLNQVRVYFFNGTAWTLQQSITDPGTSGNNFGGSVDISGDRILVGASSANSSAGRAYLYLRSGTTWSLSNTYNPPGGTGGDGFGSAVAFGGTSVFISAIASSYGVDGAITSGVVFTYSSYTSWVNYHNLQSYVVPGSSDQFGRQLIAWPNGVYAASSPAAGQQRGVIVFGNVNSVVGGLLGDSGTAFQFGAVIAGNTRTATAAQEMIFTSTLQGANPPQVRVYRTGGPSYNNYSLLQTITNPSYTSFGSIGAAVRTNGDLLLGGGANGHSNLVNYTRNTSANTWSQSSILSASQLGLDTTGSWTVAVGSQSGTTAVGNSWSLNTTMIGNSSVSKVHILGNPTSAAALADSTTFVSNFGTDRTTLTANQTFERTGIVMDAGESLVVANLGGGDIVAQVRGYEENV